jgi:hypothetical protein
MSLKKNPAQLSASERVALSKVSRSNRASVREPLTIKAGQPERFDNEYERDGTCALFLLFEPLVSWREVLVRERRPGWDYAHGVRYLCDEKYPEVEKIV